MESLYNTILYIVSEMRVFKKEIAKINGSVDMDGILETCVKFIIWFQEEIKIIDPEACE